MTVHTNISGVVGKGAHIIINRINCVINESNQINNVINGIDQNK